MITNNLTIVFTIKDHEAFETERQRLFSMFHNHSDAPYSITAISCADEITRIELIQDSDDLDEIAEILNCIDPTKYEANHD